MMTILISLPALILVLSVAYLFIDAKKGWKLFVPLLLIQLVLFGLFIYYALLLLNDQKALANKIQMQELQINKSMQSTSLVLAHLGFSTEQNNDPLKRSLLYGLSTNNAFFKGMDEADAFLTELIEEETKPLSQKIKVLQIPEDVNQELVAQLFKQIGFSAYYAGQKSQAPRLEDITTEEEDGTLTLSLNFQPDIKKQAPFPVDELDAVPVGNVLNIGKRVSPKDAKVAALVLLRAGAHIKYIKRFKKHTRRNSHAIEVGHKDIYDKRPTLTPERIKKMKKIR